MLPRPTYFHIHYHLNPFHFVLVKFEGLVAKQMSNKYWYVCMYHRSGNFRVIKFSCFKFSRKNIFVVQDTHENFLAVLRSHV